LAQGHFQTTTGVSQAYFRGGIRMFCNTPRGQGPQRKCRTPRRERPGSGYQEEQPVAGPIEQVLNDASQFPALPKELNARQGTPGRKARRSHTAWGQIPSEGGMPTRTRSLSRDMREEPSQQGSSHVDEEAPRGSSRSRAYSHDAGVDALAELVNADEPRTVRSALKKPKDNVALGAGGFEEQEMIRKMKELMDSFQDLKSKQGFTDTDSQMGMVFNRLLTSKPTEHEAEPIKKTCVDFGQDDEVATTEVVRPRRMSNPRAPTMELPTGMSWEYPLTKEEKKARVVMISDAEIDGLQEENAALQEEVGRRVDQSK